MQQSSLPEKFDDSREEQGFEVLKNMILKNLGLKCDFYRDSYLRRRINYRMRSHGIDSYWNYINLLKINKKEFSLLIKDLTINYTKFFRDPDVFEFFKEQILPNLLASKKTIRILSAGCASGEEPYTISMIINDILGEKINAYLISIYAVDIDNFCLKKAECGEYDQQELLDMSEHYMSKYFVREGQKFRVKENVKKLVHFKCADLTQKLPYKFLDVIFCRNVFIYFNKSGQAEIFKNFYDCLNKDGYLIIGKTEMLPEEVRKLFKCLNSVCKVFQKNEITETSSLDFSVKEFPQKVVQTS
ncbi:MAG: protein-glutamate O-methyltransferase CheR [Candidatus Bathyarchaeia archaeon]